LAAIFYCSEGEVEQVCRGDGEEETGTERRTGRVEVEQVCRGDGEEDAATERRTGRVEVDGRFSRVTASLASPPPVRP